MNLVKVKCAFCGKEFFRPVERVNEAKKFAWNQYCSKECQDKAKTTRVEKICGNPNCNNKVSRALNQFRRSKSGLIFCSCSCAAVVNNKKYPKRSKGNASRPRGATSEFLTCVNCGKKFRKSKGNLKYCSRQCRKKARRKYSPQQITDIIKHTVQELGRVPARREMKEIANRCPGVFGSWNNAIIAAGFQPNRSHNQRMYRCANVKAMDGHLCDTVSEAIIDDWLTRNKIPHKRNAPYPKTNHNADWVIHVRNHDVFVEYFGLANDSPRYDRTIRKKNKLCRRYDLNLIEIYPQDLYPKKYLDDKLRDKFRGLIRS